YPPPLDAWFEVRAWPVPEGLTVYFLDVTARHLAEQEREEANARLRLIVEAGDRLGGSLEADTIAATLVDLAVPRLGELAVVAVRAEIAASITGRPVAADEDDVVRVLHVRHQDPAKEDAVRRLVSGTTLTT